MYGGAGRHDRGIPLILLWGDMKLRLMILFMLPMTADGFLQLFTSYESKK